MARSSRRRPLTRLLSAPALAIALLLTCLTVHAQSEPALPRTSRPRCCLAAASFSVGTLLPRMPGRSPATRSLRRRPNRGENTLLSYVGDTRSNATTYTDLDAREPGEQYVYRVVALRGSSRSGRSNFARLVMPELVPVEPDPADLAPTNLAVRVAADGAALSWDAPAADAATVTGYRVLRSVGASAMTILADTGSDDTNLHRRLRHHAGETYGYQVLAMRGAETSGGSNTVSVSAPQAPDVPRSAASRVADATAPGNSHRHNRRRRIALSWDAPTEGANFLRGYRSAKPCRSAVHHSQGKHPLQGHVLRGLLGRLAWYDLHLPGQGPTGQNVSEGSNQASLTRPACDGGSFNVTPEDVPVTAVPIVGHFHHPGLLCALRATHPGDRPRSSNLGDVGGEWPTTLQDRLEPLPGRALPG